MARGDELIGDRLGGIHRDCEADALRLHTWLSLACDQVWLIFLMILLFAPYPAASAALSVAFLRAFSSCVGRHRATRRGLCLPDGWEPHRMCSSHVGSRVRDREYAAAGAPEDHPCPRRARPSLVC
jgi:hypothetical protein